MTEVEVDLSDTADGLVEQARRILGKGHLVNTRSVPEVLRDRLRRADERTMLQRVRAGRELCVDDDVEPLVTVRVTTFERANVLLERTMPSILAQTYPRIEILVVGDCTSDDTEKRLRRLSDPRIHFMNLPYRPLYPPEPERRWRVLGYQALNVSLDLARGSWIAPCDDDDELTPTHVESLLAAAQRDRAEFVHSKTALVLGDGVLGVIGRPTVADGQTSHGAIFYSARLRFFRYNPEVWRLRRSLDWDLIHRMAAAGVRMTFLDEITYRYHPSPASLSQWHATLLARRPDLRVALTSDHLP